MKLIEILQGKWLGHPLHAALVHVPVGGWLVAAALDVVIAAGWSAQPVLPKLAFYAVGLGLLGAVIAAITGIAEWLAIKPGKPAKKLGVYHMILNLAAAVLFGVNFALRLENETAVTGAVLGTSISGALLVIVGAYIGSLIVFDQGIGVARYSKKEWRSRALRGGSRVPEES